MRAELENMQGYAICANPFYLMEEADWVVLRLLLKGVYLGEGIDEAWKAQEYLYEKYSQETVISCIHQLRRNKHE